jgi:Ca2+-transporting ATPase
MRPLYHALEAKEVLKLKESSLKGLNSSEAERRLERFGPNELRKERRVKWLEILLRQLRSPFVLILILAAALSLLLEELFDSLTILFIVLLNAALGFSQEYRAEKALEALKRFMVPKAKVVRDGSVALIPAREVVPGDIVLVEAGDRVPADARLLEVINLKVDESVLTGESIPSAKHTRPLQRRLAVADRENMIYMGTLVTYGRGKGVIVETGMGTEFGKLAEQIQEIREGPTILQLRLRGLALRLGGFVLGLCTLLFLLMGWRGEPWLSGFMIAVALGVSAVPEGLPAVVTIALALGVRRMAKRNAIVRRLASVETLGCATVICTDKTGTLTKNEMTVKEIFVNNRLVQVAGTGYEPKGQFISNSKPFEPREDEHLMLLLRIGCLCNLAHLSREDWSLIGDPTEGALLTLAGKAGMWREEELADYPLLAELPFDPRRKRMTTIHLVGKRRMAYIKGAPEVLLELSTSIFERGKARKLGARKKRKILEEVGKMASKALRVLAFAYKEVDSKGKLTPEKVERELTFVGIAGMIDPPRPEVKKAIERCKKAGIKVVMVTGDHKLTAEAIAKDIGLLGEGKVVTGIELDGMSDEQLLREADEIAVYARVSPGHKVRILEALKRKGHVVAMTGDGVNDAPAVKRADIGIAMGIKGTDVTKEASDMILADDNFATIVDAVEEGRGIYDNIRKFVRFLLSVNFSGIFLVATSALAGLPLPLLPLQILWINVVTDGLPALALGVDPYDPELMKRGPRKPKEGILHGMLPFVLTAALFAYFSRLFTLVWSLGRVSLAKLRTLVFTQAVMGELLFALNCRSEKRSVFKIGLAGNKKLLIAILSSVLLHLMVIYVPLLQFVFKTTALGLYDWLVILPLTLPGLFVFPEIFMRS